MHKLIERNDKWKRWERCENSSPYIRIQESSMVEGTLFNLLIIIPLIINVIPDYLLKSDMAQSHKRSLDWLLTINASCYLINQLAPRYARKI